MNSVPELRSPSKALSRVQTGELERETLARWRHIREAPSLERLRSLGKKEEKTIANQFP
jgi:hypothetical protein